MIFLYNERMIECTHKQSKAKWLLNNVVCIKTVVDYSVKCALQKMNYYKIYSVLYSRSDYEILEIKSYC